MVGKLAQDVEMVQDLVPCLVAFGISIPTCLFHLKLFSYLLLHMQEEVEAKNAQVQQQLQERDAEINRLRRDLRALREHIVRVHTIMLVTDIRQQI